MTDLTLPLALSFTVFVWLKTNAVIDFFGKLLAYWNIGYVGEYIKLPPSTQSTLPYPLWLFVNHQSFLTKLISCPLCCSFWVNFIFAPNLKMWLHNAFWTLIGFLVLDRLYKHGK